MKLDKRFTPVCWIVLVLFSSSLLFARYSSLATGTSSAADIVIFLVWIGLVTAPVFHELNLARSSLETRVDSLKAQVQNLTSSIQTQTQSININNYPSLPKDDEIGQRRKEAAEILGKRPQERSLPEQASLPEDSGLNYLFNVRRYLELELRRITGAHFDSAWDYRRSSLPQAVQRLVGAGVLAPKLAQLVEDVYAICSAVVHGDDASPKQIAYAKEISPGVIAALRDVR
jgi:hypothetical protein